MPKAETAAALGLDVFYPIVPDVRALARLVPLGVRTVQLRLKDAPRERILAEIRESLDIAARHRCQLIVNDYWREALEVGAEFVHLGQEDLATADLVALKSRHVRIGISTHSDEELDIALAADPDYVALGPIYPTTLKVMRFAPQGLERIGVWKARIGALPLVAIGGITLERAEGVLAHGAQSIAVVSDVLSHPDPEARTRAWVAFAAGRIKGPRQPEVSGLG